MARPPVVVIALVVLAVAVGAWRLSRAGAPFGRPPIAGLAGDDAADSSSGDAADSSSGDAADSSSGSDVGPAAPGAPPLPGTGADRPDSRRPGADKPGSQRERRAHVVGSPSGRGASASLGSDAAPGASPVGPDGELTNPGPDAGPRIDLPGVPRQAPQGRGPAPVESVDGGVVEEDAPADEVLLSVPFDGDLDPAVGSPPAQAVGVEIEGEGVEFTDEGVVSFPADGNLNTEAGTISFDVVPNWAGSDETNNSFVQIYRGEHEWGNRLSLVKNFQSLRFVFVDNTGAERNVGLRIDDWLPGEARRVTATWGDALMSLYVDGRLVGQNTYPGTLDLPPGAQIYIGYRDPGSSYASVGGRIRDLQVYGRALGADEIERR